MGKLIKSKGNMYNWVTHTWSPIQGCPHQCKYCYVRKFKNFPETVTVEEPFPHLGTGKKIFVAHMGDLFAYGVSGEIIGKVLKWCNQFDNEYVFQSKNTSRMHHYRNSLPKNSTVGTTIETNRNSLLGTISNAPSPELRACFLKELKRAGFKTFVAIEPVMELCVTGMKALIDLADPDFINIGADSKGQGLREPHPLEIIFLLDWFKEKGIPVKIKSNLERLIGKVAHEIKSNLERLIGKDAHAQD